MSKTKYFWGCQQKKIYFRNNEHPNIHTYTPTHICGYPIRKSCAGEKILNSEIFRK